MLEQMRNLGVGHLAGDPVRRAAVATVSPEPGQQSERRLGKPGYGGRSCQARVTNVNQRFDGCVTDRDPVENEGPGGHRTAGA